MGETFCKRGLIGGAAMPVYPFYNHLQTATRSMDNGNFGLWYNKFVPVTDFQTCKASDDSDDKDNKDKPVEHYFKMYNRLKKNPVTGSLLSKKHLNQAELCEAFSSRYEKVVFKATLKTPLVTGIGESHPHEVSMVFDHNLGIPYIPASGVKGLVRFAHTLSLIPSIPEGMLKHDKDGKPYFNEEEPWTQVADLFGTQAQRGSVMFLDAYPEKIPELHVEIMNPHYGGYHSDDNHRTPPGDYLDPTPIKFLTTTAGTVFIFRALVDKEKTELPAMVKAAYKKILIAEGVGAKTAVGYGRFSHVVEEESASVVDFIKKEKDRKQKAIEEAKTQAESKRKETMTTDEIKIEEISTITNDTDTIAKKVDAVLSGEFGKAVYQALKDKLKEYGQWKPDGSKQKKEKMRTRNEKIDNKINAI